MGTNFTDLATTDNVTATTFNDVLDELDAAIVALQALDGGTVSEVYESDGGALAIDTDASGNVTKPNSVAFMAYSNASQDNVTGNGATYNVVFNTESYDRNSGYNNANGLFTAPITGRYNFSAGLNIAGITSSHTDCILLLSTTGRTYYLAALNPYAVNRAAAGTLSLSGAVIGADLAATETARIQLIVSNGTQVVDIDTGSYFSGELAG